MSRWRRIRRAGAAATSLTLLAVLPAAALAQFPYPGGINQPESPAYRLAPGQTPSNFSETGDWELSATPDTSVASQASVNNQPDQLCGVRGISLLDADTAQPSGCLAGQPVKTAFEVTTGNPDVHIAVLDSGIEWNDAGVMAAEADKIWLNTGELPAPRHDLATPLAPLPGGRTCASLASARGGDYNRLGNYWPNGRGADVGGYYDVLGDGAVNVLDWACDSRVAKALYPALLNQGLSCPGASACKPSPLYHGPLVKGRLVLTPEALILAFSDGKDEDRNGFTDDIAGWNFVDNNNDPFDDVQYGHGSGEAKDSTAEANSSSTVGSCPNCMIMPLRVGESFVTDANRFAQAVLYATDMGADVVQEALGTYNAPLFARQAIEYAYHHGTTVIASAADEAAEHHNQPGALPDTIVVNSVNEPDSVGGVGATNVPPSYLQLNGCTNWGTRVDLAVEGSSCSSESTGKSSGVTGLIYSAAEDALAAGRLTTAAGCTRVDGTPCMITPNEVRQLLASGNIAGDPTAGQSASTGTAPADAGNGGQADDVNFAAQPEGSCTQSAVPTCTDPNSNTMFALDMDGGILGPAPDTYQYPARKGFDEFYGYGRLNAYKAVAATLAGHIPPQADITSPDWFTQVNPALASFALDGSVSARDSYTCRVDVAPGVEPNNALASASPPGDFHTVASSWCDGHTVHTTPYSGPLAAVNIAYLKSLFPPGNPGSFTGNENGAVAQTANGRPNTQPYAFTVRVVVSAAHGLAMTGEDRRQLFLHRDAQMLPGWPRELRTDGDSTPILADIEGDDRSDLLVATSDGWIYALRPNGSEAPGWPVHTDRLPLHTGEAAYRRGGVGIGHYAAILGGLAAGDLFHNGQLDVVADDMDGNVYAWNGQGQLVFHAHSNPAWSGAPRAYPRSPTGALATVRKGPRDRTEAGFLSSPVLANLTGGPGPLDIIVAGEDRHLYAWQPSGRPVRGFPVFVEDPDKLTAVDSSTSQPTFSTSKAEPNPGIEEDQGKIIDTPAVAYVNGPGKPPTIYLGTNEEYTVNTGDEGPINATGGAVTVVGASGALQFANGRVYAISSSGGQMSCAGGHCRSSAFLRGWPVKIGIIDEGLLPDVGEGIDGSPVVAQVSCPNGGRGFKIGVSPDAGPAYILNQDGSSCYGSTNGQYNTLASDVGAGNGQKVDSPTWAAVGYPAFGTLDGSSLSMFDQGSGLIRALDVAVNGEQKNGQNFILGWNTSTSQFDAGYPAVVNDLGFLTGETVGDITGNAPQQEVLGGTASLDVAAFNSSGSPASSAWPKLSGDWVVATPLLGAFGALAWLPGAAKDVITVTRSGTLSVYGTPAGACSPSSWPNWHHDLANSGDYSRDAVPPGVPTSVSLSGRVLRFVAPGGDDGCGRATRYQLVNGSTPITPARFAVAKALRGAPAPAAAGAVQSLTLPRRTARYIAIRAVDEQGNLGLPAVIDTLGASKHGRPAATCAALGPTSSLSRVIVRGRRVSLAGSSLDRSCRLAAVARVLVSVSRRLGARCEFLQSNGRLTGPHACSQPVYLSAAIGAAHAGRRVGFALHPRRAFPAGSYTAVAIASDRSGRVELAGRWDTRAFRVL